jgi:Fe-S cluster biosynthesis and repair protein YggX
MNKLIFCQFLKKETLALLSAPYPGPLGLYLMNHISQEAWVLWINEQTKFINENRLMLYKKDDRDFLLNKLHEFFKINPQMYLNK